MGPAVPSARSAGRGAAGPGRWAGAGGRPRAGGVVVPRAGHGGLRLGAAGPVRLRAVRALPLGHPAAQHQGGHGAAGHGLLLRHLLRVHQPAGLRLQRDGAGGHGGRGRGGPHLLREVPGRLQVLLRGAAAHAAAAPAHQRLPRRRGHAGPGRHRPARAAAGVRLPVRHGAAADPARRGVLPADGLWVRAGPDDGRRGGVRDGHGPARAALPGALHARRLLLEGAQGRGAAGHVGRARVSGPPGPPGPPRPARGRRQRVRRAPQAGVYK
mmetsp:Transcript_8577/g.13886  ORF Transcript_8577/g.13886 Transcript_8577/m.13886 type:complete len:269 (+) Transcript_8577:1091-1897(+)